VLAFYFPTIVYKFPKGTIAENFALRKYFYGRVKVTGAKGEINAR